jgi:hypothetical protein
VEHGAFERGQNNFYLCSINHYISQKVVIINVLWRSASAGRIKEEIFHTDSVHPGHTLWWELVNSKEWLMNLLQTFSIWNIASFLSHCLFSTSFLACTNFIFREGNRNAPDSPGHLHGRASDCVSWILAFPDFPVLVWFLLHPGKDWFLRCWKRS